MKYKRILIKLSGEVFSGKNGYGMDTDILSDIGNALKKVHDKGIQIAVVVGAGNYVRGRDIKGILRSRADSMGMLATVINSIALKDALEKKGLDSDVYSAICMSEVCKTYRRDDAVRDLDQGIITILAAGTGNPYFSTDMAAALRGIEINADIILYAKNIDGVYDKDPKSNPDARKYAKIKYSEIITKQLNVIDIAAAVLCDQFSMNSILFALETPENIVSVIDGKNIGTIIEK
ncbi:MAG: UMP kinase [Clostridia bacterium]|jgi:uridylate kinase